MDLHNVNYIPQRDGYGQGLLALCAQRQDVLVLDADVSASTRTNWVKDQYPDHFYNLGISEQDLVGTAAGLALGGLIPYVSTYGVFLSGRAFDQLRTTVCYNNLKVRFGGAHAGISVGPDGATHQALEDIALARVLPHMTVIAPCDSEETRKAVIAAADIDGPVYFRFGREAVPLITDEATPFTIGKARLVRQGTDCAVFACGAMVYEALLAAETLAQQGISLRVIDLHTIKPLDEEAVLDAARACGALVTAEEHQMAGGLFGAVAEAAARLCPVPMEAVAVHDTFGESGSPQALMDRYGLNAAAIVRSVRWALARKG
ncbi:MAG: transketolase family protein [Clostridiales bacterium]|nr:transketolase family protein [Clostridiales bacterium]MDY4171497.1 transketolase C-terminal domain-containing protein [Evtepia sp.]